MRSFFIVTILFAAFASLARSAERPNILFIAIDDQNDWIGYIGGHPQARTPNIDRLAARGTAFTNAHCQSPLCNSSRTSLMLGKRPDSTGIYGLAPWFRDVPELKDAVPLPRYLKQHGYTTYSTGKIYHGPYGRKPKDREFDHLGPGATGAPYPKKKLVNTHNHDNHGVRSENWRYIRYADGSEELYDMQKDPNEWSNLAGNPEYEKIIAEHRKWIPEVSRKPAPGSRARILTYDPEGKTIWEGKEIGEHDPIPEL